MYGLKGANQKSDALIDALEEYFQSSAFKALPPGSPNRPSRSTYPSASSTAVNTTSRQLKPIPSQGVARALPSRPAIRKSPSKVEVVVSRERPSKAVASGEPVGGSISAPSKQGEHALLLSAIMAYDSGRLPPPRPAPSAVSVPSDALTRRVSLLSDRVQDIEAGLAANPLTTMSGEIASLRAEVSRLDLDIASLRSEKGSGSASEDNDGWAKQLQEVEDRWSARFTTAEAVWAERFSVLESKIGESSRAGEEHDTLGDGLSVIALGKRREREDPIIGFPSDDHRSPHKRARTDEVTSPSSREHLMALARRSASPHKSPRTPSPGRSSSQGVFKTPELPASMMKHLQSQPILAPKTPSPGHQGLLPDNSATPGFATDSNYFAGLPPTITDSSSRRKNGEVNLPFPLFATTPRPVAPTSPTTDAPPSTSRRARADSSSSQMMTPGRRPTRTVSHAHMELSTVTEDPSFSIPSASPPSRPRSTEAIDNLPPIPGTTQHIPLFGPELALDKSDRPPSLSPSPSITETRFSSLPFPSKKKPISAPSALGQTSPLIPTQSALPGRMTANTVDTTPPCHAGAAGLGMMTPGHRTMLGTESYRDTRFGDLPVMMAWGTPEMPDTPRAGGSGSVFGSGT